MKIIYLAGGSGYIGTAISNLLLKMNDIRVVSLDLNRPIIDGVEWIECDLTDIHSIKISPKITRGDSNYGFIHLAAWKDLTESNFSPFEYYRNNIESLLNSINLANQLGCKRFIFSSSSAVYPDNAKGATPEFSSDAVEWNSNKSPYGETKVIGELITKKCCEQFNIKSICLRYCNPVGTDGISLDISNSMFGNIFNNLNTPRYSRNKFIIFGCDWDTDDGTCVRDYIDIRDVARAHSHFLFVENTNHKHICVNLGTGKGVSCKQVCDTVKHLVPEFEYEIGPRREGDAAGSWAATVELEKVYGFHTMYDYKDSLISIFKYINLKYKK